MKRSRAAGSCDSRRKTGLASQRRGCWTSSATSAASATTCADAQKHSACATTCAHTHSMREMRARLLVGVAWHSRSRVIPDLCKHTSTASHDFTRVGGTHGHASPPNAPEACEARATSASAHPGAAAIAAGHRPSADDTRAWMTRARGNGPQVCAQGRCVQTHRAQIARPTAESHATHAQPDHAPAHQR